MKYFPKIELLLLVLAVSLYSCSSPKKETLSPKELTKHVSDIIVNGTTFEFTASVEEFEQDGSYLIDFPTKEAGVFYARSKVVISEEIQTLPEMEFGVTHAAGEISIQIDGNEVFSNSSSKQGSLSHDDYGLFDYNDKVKVALTEGEHTLVIHFEPRNKAENRINFGFLRFDNGLAHPAVKLHAPSEDEDFEHFGYWWLGPLSKKFDASQIENPNISVTEMLTEEYPSNAGKSIRWNLPKLNLVKGLPGKLAYQDWRYFTGTFLDAMRSADRHFSDLDYSEYINNHLNFFLDNRDDIQQMRDDYGLRESPFGHYFRYSLLDDIGMQTVPYVNRLIDEGLEGNEVEEQLAHGVSDYILEKASRLEDGTFARFTPDTMSVWADDLFMSSIVLLKMTELTGDQKYLDEVVKQVILFDSHLRDDASSLYWHGYFSRNGEYSPSKWGRANGWTMMAKTELLLAMPINHPKRAQIIEIFKNHADGLLKVQAEDGRWHQVLDNSSTYLETSATAMFVRAYAVGVIEGWLPKEKYAESIDKGWNALAQQIDEDGNVIGIVRGTPIMFSDQEYADWGARLNDPRGLGAVIYAAIAMDEYQNMEN
tara:strand:- start:7936 stop:9720 length:1785 start_codon:yes stop_codon:yes gene_type:complete